MDSDDDLLLLSAAAAAAKACVEQLSRTARRKKRLAIFVLSRPAHAARLRPTRGMGVRARRAPGSPGEGPELCPGRRMDVRPSLEGFGGQMKCEGRRQYRRPR